MVSSVGTAVFVVMVKLVMTEAKLACRQDSGTFSLLVTGTQNCEDSSWKAGDGTVLAYDETYNKTVVLGTDQSPGHYRITFRTCLPDVTFTCNKEAVSCEYTCPGRFDPNHGPATTGVGPAEPEPPMNELSRERVGIIGSALVVLLLIIIIIISALRAKHTDRFQAEV